MAGNINSTEYGDMRFYQRSQATVIIEGLAALVIMILSLTGNIIICMAFIQRKTIPTNFRLYILSHAMADIILAVVAMPFSVVTLFQGQWVFGSRLCSFQGIVAVWSCEASILTMTLAAIHRYTKMLKTPFHKRVYTKRFIIRSLVLGWMVAVMGPVAYILRGDTFKFVSAFVVCTFDYNTLDITFAVLMVVFLSVFPFSVITFCYYKVWRYVQQHNATMQTGSVSAEEIRLTKLVSAILVSFIVCWAPLVIVVLIVVFNELLIVPRQVCLFVIFMASISGCLNPIIHGALIKECRKNVCKMCCVGNQANQIEAESHNIS